MRIKTLLSFIIISFLSTSVFAQLHPLDRLATFENCPQYLQLSQAKKDKVRAVINDAKQKMDPVWTEMHKAWFNMEAQFDKTKLDKKAIKKLSDRMSELYGKVLQNFTETRIKIIEKTGFRPGDCFKVSKEKIADPKPDSSPCDNPNSSMCAIPLQK